MGVIVSDPTDSQTTRHFLKGDFSDRWEEVNKEKWIKAERAAGFRPKMASVDPRYMDTYATGGFAGNGVRGIIRYDGSEP
jgi:hypothetical protein